MGLPFALALLLTLLLVELADDVIACGGMAFLTQVAKMAEGILKADGAHLSTSGGRDELVEYGCIPNTLAG